MDNTQGLKAALRALADRKTFASGIHMAVSDSSIPQPSKLLFQQHFKVVFVDSSGWMNLAGNVSESQLAEVCVIGHSCVAVSSWGTGRLKPSCWLI